MDNSTKMLGGIGYICLLIFALASGTGAGGVLALAAMICVVVAFIKGGNEVGRPDVKNSMILAIVLNIVAFLLLGFVIIGAIIAFLGAAAATNSQSADALAAFSFFGILGLVVSGLIYLALQIAASWFWYKASKALGEGTNEPLFTSGGLVIFIGALTMIIGVGVLVMFVGWVMQCVAFFKVPESNPMPNVTP